MVTRHIRVLVVGLVGVLAMLSGCASTYTSSSFSGGYAETRISDTTWTIRYGGNGYTSVETVQTYWLYHCAEFALSKGYDGFSILTPIDLSAITPLKPQSAGGGRIIRVHGGGGGGHGGGVVVIYGYGGAQPFKPWLQGNIALLKNPVTPVPGRVFDAAALKALLGPHVLGDKCGGNVCPYVHTYLYPAPAAGS